MTAQAGTSLWPQVEVKASHIRLFLTTVESPVPPLFMVHKLLLFLSHHTHAHCCGASDSPVLRRGFLSWHSLLSDDSSLTQVDIKFASTCGLCIVYDVGTEGWVIQGIQGVRMWSVFCICVMSVCGLSLCDILCVSSVFGMYVWFHCGWCVVFECCVVCLVCVVFVCCMRVVVCHSPWCCLLHRKRDRPSTSQQGAPLLPKAVLCPPSPREEVAVPE